MSMDIPAGDLVRQLLHAGLRPEERLVAKILEHGPAARRELLKLACTTELLHHDDVHKSLGPIHALRLLGELPDSTIIAPLLKTLPIEIYSDEDTAAQLYANEILQIIGRVGAEAMPVLQELRTSGDLSEAQQRASINALAYVATYAPEVRDEIIAWCREKLNDPSAAYVTGESVVLAELGDSESYKAVMEAYRNGRIEKDIAPAAQARQFLLSGGRKNLTCVSHPLWERYDHHGPSFRV